MSFRLNILELITKDEKSLDMLLNLFLMAESPVELMIGTHRMIVVYQKPIDRLFIFQVCDNIFFCLVIRVAIYV